jgi:hypothetical protein
MRNLAISLPIRLPLAALCLCLGARALQAQTEPRADVLSGRVTDLAGKPVADAQVITTAPASGVTRSAITDADGRYKIYFPETAPLYRLQVKRMGFSPVERTINRHTTAAEQMTIDLQLGGTPLALSMVEINGTAEPLPPHDVEKITVDASVPNPISEILALKDTLHLSAVQIVGLSELGDTLQAKNSRIYKNIKTLLAKSAEAGDVTQMAGSVAMMLEEASGNTSRAVSAAQKLLRQEQWDILPPAIRDRTDGAAATTAKQD